MLRYLTWAPCLRCCCFIQELEHHPKYVLPSDMAKVVAWQLLRALEHCHKQGVVHRDVKVRRWWVAALL